MRRSSSYSLIAAWILTYLLVGTAGTSGQVPRGLGINLAAPAGGGGGGGLGDFNSDTQGGITVTIASPGALRDQDGFNWTTCGVPTTHGHFTFCSPYNTLAYRLTDANDCSAGGPGTVADCIRQAWYSNKSQMFYRGRQQDADPGTPVCSVIIPAYAGAWKYCVDFSQSPPVRTKTEIFESADRLTAVNSRTDNWMVSPTEADILYIVVDNEIRRCDVTTANLPISSTNNAECELLLDIQTLAFRNAVAADSACGGITAGAIANANVWSLYVQNNANATPSADRILATFYILDPEDGVICNAYIQDWDNASTTTYFGAGLGDSGITPDGRFGTWLTQSPGCESHPTIPGAHGPDMFIRDFQLDTTMVWCDQDGGPGHLGQVWQGYLAEDNFAVNGQQLRYGNFLSFPAMGTPPTGVYHNVEYGTDSYVQPTMLTAQDTANLPFNQQIACTLTTTPEPDNNWALERELVCFKIGSSQALVVAPSMTLFGTSGCGGDETVSYYCAPKPPISSDGRWILLMTNRGTSRMDAFYIRVPRNNIPAASPPGPAPVPANPASGTGVSTRYILPSTRVQEVDWTKRSSDAKTSIRGVDSDRSVQPWGGSRGSNPVQEMRWDAYRRRDPSEHERQVGRGLSSGPGRGSGPRRN